MTHAELEQLVDGIAPVIAAHIKKKIAEATAPLVERVAALEAQPVGVKYCGTFQTGHEYARGSLTTKHGGLWLALDTTRDTPGNGASSWRLIVKEGQAR
jgi:hypothetical protein